MGSATCQGGCTTVELTPKGVACNISCTYCYQHPMRDAGNIGNDVPYDFAKMFAALDQEGAKFSVFGGEPLLVPLPDLIRIFDYGFAKWKENGIQTNGVLITPEHIEAFKRYKVHVGFSLDGPGELNDSRWSGTLERTRENTEKSHANLKACIDAGVSTSVIITLYRGNALPDRLPRLKDWIRSLDQGGTRGVRIHVLEIDHPDVKEKMQLTQDETIHALRELAALERTLSRTGNLFESDSREEAEQYLATVIGRSEYPRPSIWERKKGDVVEKYVVWNQGLELDIMSDIRNLLRANDEHVTCVWNPCDPYTTSAVRGVDGQGNRSNCGRTNKDGILRLKAERQGYERQLALYNTPYEHGGCKGCRFFLMCKSQCPGTAIDGDWRNRSSDCRIWMTLFEDVEREMMLAGEMPLSIHPIRPTLEKAMLQLWEQGHSMSLKAALEFLKKATQQQSSASLPQNQNHGDEHGDHTDMSKLLPNAGVPHGDAPHGDVPHGDDHGDHTDYGSRNQPLGVAEVVA